MNTPSRITRADSPWLHYLWLAFCCLVTGTLAAVVSSRLCLWFDELGTVQTSQRPLIESFLQIEDYAAPLYQLLLRAAWHSGYPPEWVVRAPAFLSALFGLVATWWFATALFGRRVAAFTTFLVAFNPVFIRYAVEGRPYSMFLFLSVASVGAFWTSLRKPTRMSACIHVIFSAMLVYSHFFGFLVLFAEAVFALIFAVSHRGSKSIRRMAFAFGAIALASAPALWLASRYVTTGLQGLRSNVAIWHRGSLLLLNMGEVLFESRALSVLYIWALGVATWILVRTLVQSKAAAQDPQDDSHDSWWGALLCLMWFGASYYILVFGTVMIKPFLSSRYLLPAMLPCALLLSYVVCRMTRAVQVLVLLLTMAAYYPAVKAHLAETRRDYPEMAALIHQSNPSKDTVYVAGCPDDPHYYRSILEDGLRYYGYDEPNIALLELSWNENQWAYSVREPGVLQTNRRFFVVAHWRGYADPVEELLKKSSREYKKREWGPSRLTLFEVTN
jgi:uncharacterized membrane protein